MPSLRGRRSNIDARQIGIRMALCQALGVPEDRMPFAGELIEVRDSERDWEGAIERLMHNFGLSLLVPEALYARVAERVDETPLHEAGWCTLRCSQRGLRTARAATADRLAAQADHQARFALLWLAGAGAVAAL
ncbi:MAG: hypothetical protein U5M53_12710 [Rhodoferax sp.]|nr:hypothetical protein [Rhodoferax sp.]